MATATGAADRGALEIAAAHHPANRPHGKIVGKAKNQPPPILTPHLHDSISPMAKTLIVRRRMVISTKTAILKNLIDQKDRSDPRDQRDPKGFKKDGMMIDPENLTAMHGQLAILNPGTINLGNVASIGISGTKSRRVKNLLTR